MQHRFEDVLSGVVTLLLDALFHEVNAQLQVKVLFLQSCDLLQIKETFLISSRKIAD